MTTGTIGTTGTTGSYTSELSPILGDHLNQWDLTELERFSFTDWLWRAIDGQLDLTPNGIIMAVVRLFFDELWLHAALIRQLLLIAVISAVIRVLANSFKRQSVGELGFYVSYILILATVISSFRMAAGLLSDLVMQTSRMMEAAVPLMIGLTVMSGNVGTAAFFQPIILLGLALMTRFISYVFIPLTTAAAILHIVNHLSEGNIFSKMVKLLKKSAKNMLKFLVFLFLSLLTLHKISVPIANNLAVQTARATARAVPVVGSAISSAVDIVLYLGAAARSGVLVALIIIICVAISMPLIKLLVIMFIYKIMAAVIQPICDSRIVDCLDGLGDYIALLLGAGVLISVMFIFTIVIMLI